MTDDIQHNKHIAQKAIENGFPIAEISQLAEFESWRKEIYRPVYYIHKWWARRLGSVFRAIIIGCGVDQNQDIAHLLSQPIDLKDKVVFDPFMGSGTTIGEAVKLGCRVIGRDINPVSLIMVKTALQQYSRLQVESTYKQIDHQVGRQIRELYSYRLPGGETAEILYYFWVKIIPCPQCGYEVELFKSRIFAKHAYPHKYPQTKAVCPACGSLNNVRYDAENTVCDKCSISYNPQVGVVRDSRVSCPQCEANFSIIEAVRSMNQPPHHKMYAKMVLLPNGTKEFLPIHEADHASYQRAIELLPSLWHYIPSTRLEAGYNTNQVLNYNYQFWHQMFNARQLVALALLASEISKIVQPELKLLFACLFSGTLEFNNMFASFKGLGTGAVRHMFAHHILKPELTPLEANVWGTDKSSGSFSTLFQTRILRALDYKSAPFELVVKQRFGKLEGEKVEGLSKPIQSEIVATYDEFRHGRAAYLSAGDSASTDIASESVDFVVTDPPFFDNVHYSELADFFYVWLRQILASPETMNGLSTRSTAEVQNTDVGEFTTKLGGVLSECYRVLKQDGLLVFTYHHSRQEGWVAVYMAVRTAGFRIVKAHPIKSEMAVSISIQQSKTPINFDMIFVCRKEIKGQPSFAVTPPPQPVLIKEVQDTINELVEMSLPISRGDIRVILMGNLLARLSEMNNLNHEIAYLKTIGTQIEAWTNQIILPSVKEDEKANHQLAFRFG